MNFNLILIHTQTAIDLIILFAFFYSIFPRTGVRTQGFMNVSQVLYTTWATLADFTALVILEIDSGLFAQAGLDTVFLF
jgi:hypothetical protein